MRSKAQTFSPYQVFAAIDSADDHARRKMPEMRLVYAVLGRAILDWKSLEGQEGMTYLGGRYYPIAAPKARAELREWFESDDDGPFSFLWLVEAIFGSPVMADWIRKELFAGRLIDRRSFGHRQ